MDSNLKYQNKSSNEVSDFNKDFPDDLGILLISHGSSLPHASETFNDILRKFKEITGYPTEVGYMKVAKPSISEAINKLTENKNINKIIAMPVFLAPGIHTNIDIPIILGLDPLENDPRCPDGNYPENHYLNNFDNINFDGEIVLIKCIGADPLVLDIIDKRIESTLKNSKLDSKNNKTGILLISHGSRLNYNREFITDVFNQYKIKTNYKVGQGFMELMEPSIPQAVNELTKDNDLDRLIVVPVFIAPGVHTIRDIPTILGLLDDDDLNDTHSHNHSNLNEENNNHSHNHSHSHSHHHEKIDFDGEVLYADPLGADSLIIEIIKERINNEINIK